MGRRVTARYLNQNRKRRGSDLSGEYYLLNNRRRESRVEPLNPSALGMLHLVEAARRACPDAFRMVEGVTGMKTNWCYAEENPN